VNFSDVYYHHCWSAAHPGFSMQVLPKTDGWEKIEEGLKSLLQQGGPDPQNATVLDELRKKLRSAAAKNNETEGAVIWRLAQHDGAKSYSRERAALLKMMRHFYLVNSAGAQSFWVLDLPKSYTAWPRDLLMSKSDTDIPATLNQNNEVFGSRRRKRLRRAWQVAKEESLRAQGLLGKPSPTTLKKIQMWFLEAGASSADATATAAKLRKGFDDINKASSESCVICSDDPVYRLNNKQKKTEAMVDRSEKKMVVYIFEPFFEIDEMWYYTPSSCMNSITKRAAAKTSVT